MLLMTYNLRRDKSHVQRFLDSIKCSNEVHVFILDTRPVKDKVEYETEIKVTYIDVDLEDSNKQFEISYKLAQGNNCLFFCNIEENVSLSGHLDLILTEDFIANGNIGISYADTLVQCKDEYKTLIPILNTTFPPRIETLPLLIFRKLPHNIAEEAIKANMSYVEIVSRLFIVKHVPEVLTTVWNE